MEEMKEFWELLKARVILLDGAMGTELLRAGLERGVCPELWNLDRPEIVREIHRRYFAAGSDAVLTNSFGGNRIKLSSYGLEERCFELNFAAARLAVSLKGAGNYVGGSIGPTGKFLKPQGDFEEHDFEEAFAVQAEALSAGRVDFLLIETMYDLREALCALRAARGASSLPVFVTMTFTRTPRGYFTVMGDKVQDCVEKLEANGAQALGANCTLDSRDMVELIPEIRRETRLPVIAQPNAGRPLVGAGDGVTYSQGIDDFIRHIPELIAEGVNIIGGCCGTNPDYIRQMARMVKAL